MRSQEGVQRGEPLWQEVWGLRPQFPWGIIYYLTLDTRIPRQYVLDG